MLAIQSYCKLLNCFTEENFYWVLSIFFSLEGCQKETFINVEVLES